MKWRMLAISARPGAAQLISYRVQCMYLYSNVPHFHTHLAIGSDASQMALSFAMLLLGLLFFSSVSANTPGQKFENQLNSPDLSLGCIRESNVSYHNHDQHDIVEPEILESQSSQACAERCASLEGGLYWTFNTESRRCHVKNSDTGSIYYSNAVSGTRACGLSNRTASPQLTTEGTVVSQQRDDFPPHQCADSNTTTICVVPEAPAPWLALDLGRGAHVERVEISSREDCCGERLSNFQVRVTETLPPSGISLVFS